MPKYGNMAKNPKTNVVQIMPLTQKDASNHFSQEMVHEGPFSDTRSPTIITFSDFYLLLTSTYFKIS